MAELADLLGRSPKSIQAINVTRNGVAKTYNIAAVNPATAVVLASSYGALKSGATIPACARLISGTQVQVPVTYTATMMNFTIHVVDFGQLVKSVQRGDVTGDTGGGNGKSVAIAAVNPAKCVLLLQRQDDRALTNTIFTNTSAVAAGTITFNGLGAAADINHWQLIEFR